MDAHLAETGEIAQEKGRFVALGVEFRLRLEDHLIGRMIDHGFFFATEIVEGESNRDKTVVIGRSGHGSRRWLRCRCSLGRSGCLGRRCLGGRGRRLALGERLELPDQLCRTGLVDAAAIAGDIRQIRQNVGPISA